MVWYLRAAGTARGGGTVVSGQGYMQRHYSVRMGTQHEFSMLLSAAGLGGMAHYRPLIPYVCWVAGRASGRLAELGLPGRRVFVIIYGEGN